MYVVVFYRIKQMTQGNIDFLLAKGVNDTAMSYNEFGFIFSSVCSLLTRLDLERVLRKID